MIKKVFKYSLFLFLLFLPVIKTIKAAENENLILYVQEAGNKSTAEGWTKQASMNAIPVFTLNGLWGELKEGPNGVLSFDTSGSMIDVNNQYIASTFVQPVSGQQYIASTFNNILGKPAYAQDNGYGFTGLTPILGIWMAFRNLVFMAASLMFIFLGMAIVLRIKLSPQTVVSIQSAIPSIIGTLLLITFSYAIAGLILDLITLVQGIVLAALFTATNTSLSDSLLNNSIIQIGKPSTFTFSQLMTGGLGNVYHLSLGLVSKWGLFSLTDLMSKIINATVANGPAVGVTEVITVLSAAPLITFGRVILTVIFAVVVVFYQITFMIGMIKNYGLLLFKIILGPLEIAAGMIPGSKIGFGTWVNEVFGYAMTFPVCILFLVIANMIIDKTGTNNLWIPNIIDAQGLVGYLNLIPLFIGFSALMLVSQLPTLVPQIIFSLKASPWEGALGVAYKNSIVAKTGGAIKSGGKQVANAGFMAVAKTKFPSIFDPANSPARKGGGGNIPTPPSP